MKLTRGMLAVLAAAIGLQRPAGAAPRSPSPKEMLSAVKASRVPLSQGGGECSSFATQYHTLGDLVRAFEKHAHGEREVECGPKSRQQHGLPCNLRMSNRVPPSRSEEEFELAIFFELRAWKVAASSASSRGWLTRR
jgi:hypothetical protein